MQENDDFGYSYLSSKWVAYLLFTLSLIFIAFISYHFYLHHDKETSNVLSLIMFGGGVLFNLLFLAIFQAFNKNRQKLREQKSALESSKAHLKTILDSSNDGIHALDSEGNLVEYNHSFIQMLGYTEEEAQSLKVFDWDAKLSEHEIRILLAQMLYEPMTIESLHRRKDGSIFDAEIRTQPILLNEKKVIYCYVRDITKRKREENTLVELTKRFQDIAEVSADWIWEVDATGAYIYASKSVHSLLGYTQEEMIGKRYYDLMTEVEAQRVKESFAKIIQFAEPFVDLENKVIDSQGKEHLTLTSGTPIFDASGTCVGYRGVDRDVTEQKKLENTLREKNRDLKETANQLKLATQASKMGIWVFHFEDNTFTADERVLEVFEMAPELLGIHLAFEEWSSRCHPEDVEEAVQVLQESAVQLKPLEISFRIVVPNGIKYIHTAAIVHYDKDGNPIGLIGTNRDVTTDKTVEASLIMAKESAESTNKAKSNFLANMSHEIRTPLNGVIGLLDLVLQSDLNSTQNEYLTKADMAAKALLSVLNSILDYSKIEVNKLTLERIPFDVYEVLENIHALFSYKAEEKNIDFQFNTDFTIPKQLLGDPLRLQQILSNIVGNAMKFTDTGFVRISVTAQKQEEQYRLTFEITDSGIGLTAQQQESLFSPFYQADSSFTRKYGGSGLGLMISKELVELMGGIIRVSSIPNGGTTFTFTAVFDPYEFSKQEFETIALQNQYNILATDKDIHILLVEDNDLNQLVASERLKQMGFRVSIASNGLEAVEMVKNNEYDAVLMDLQMPVMDGFTATKEIRKLPGKKKLPIIALSAAVMKEDQMLATQAGMNAHIAKPIDKVVLRDILAKWLKF